MLHQHLTTKYNWYASWHAKKHHRHIHWFTFIIAFLLSSYAVASHWQISIGQNKISIEPNFVSAQTVCNPDNYSASNLSDGHDRTADQAQIQRAINDCAYGEVVLENGRTYTIGTLELISNTTLNLNGARLLSVNDDNLLWLPKNPNFSRNALIGTASGTYNVEIKGPGIIEKKR